VFDKGKFIFVFVIFLFSKMSLPALEPTQHSVLWVTVFLVGSKAADALNRKESKNIAWLLWLSHENANKN
jgi:hypothetical protein